MADDPLSETTRAEFDDLDSEMEHRSNEQPFNDPQVKATLDAFVMKTDAIRKDVARDDPDEATRVNVAMLDDLDDYRDKRDRGA